MEKRIGVRPCAILIEKEKVLCIDCRYEDGDYFLFPGGGLEAGETIAEAAIREMLEETGFKVKIKKLVYVEDWIKDRKTNTRVLNMFFLVKRIGGSLIDGKKDGGKIKKIKWIYLKDLNKIGFRPKYIAERLYRDYKNNFKETIYFS